MTLIDRLKEMYSNVQYRNPELKPAFAGDVSDIVKDLPVCYMSEEGEEQANGTQGAAPETEKPREPGFWEYFGFALIVGGIGVAFLYGLGQMKGCEVRYQKAPIVRIR